MKWLAAALAYLPEWLEFQMRAHDLPGCSVAVAHRGEVVLERAYGYADLARRVPLTPRHAFRVASHSKSFTAAGVLRLVEQRKARLSDRVGRYVDGLHPALARATLAQLLSHTAGAVRDGSDSGQFQNRRPFLDERELRAELAAPPTLRPGERFKYSNHGYALAGLVIEAVSGEPVRDWLAREVVKAAGLRETWPDMPLPARVPLARGHSAPMPLGRRVVLPGDFETHAILPAAGFVSTAADLARYYSRLSPRARRSFLSAGSRRRMTGAEAKNTHSASSQGYGLGTMVARLGGLDTFGHSGGLLGYITRTAVAPRHDLAVSVLTNSVDGLAHFWLDGAFRILKAFAERGAPSRATRGWSGRYWSAWGALDLVPVRDRVIVAAPIAFNPFAEASELRVQGKGKAVVVFGPGYASHGEPAALVPGRELRLGGGRFLPEAKVREEMTRRYGAARRRAGSVDR